MSLVQENEPLVKIHATIKNNKIVSIDTGEEILFAKEPYLEILTMPICLSDKDQLARLSIRKSFVIMKENEELVFSFKKKRKKENDLIYEFTVKLLEDLTLKIIGQKLGSLEDCACIICDGSIDKFKIRGFKPFHASSLNNAFTKASVKYRPENASHNCNVFKKFYDKDGNILEYYRKHIDL